jgi:hypothetical protein
MCNAQALQTVKNKSSDRTLVVHDHSATSTLLKEEGVLSVPSSLLLGYSVYDVFSSACEQRRTPY